MENGKKENGKGKHESRFPFQANVCYPFNIYISLCKMRHWAGQGNAKCRM